jgi:carbon-monoxide dehydrogenase medium subunit
LKGCDYYKPETLEEAMKMMGALDDARYIAGGTDVMVLIKQKKLSPTNLISLRNICELSYIDTTNGLAIGSGITHSKVVRNEFIQKNYSALVDAAGKIGSAQVRNVATVGGNICNAAPSADTACPFLIFDADVLIVGEKGERRLSVGDFFLGPNRAALEKGEIVKGFIMPAPGENAGSAYIKHTRRRAMELPILGIAARIAVAAEGRDPGWKEAFRKLGSASAILKKMEDEKFVCAGARIAMSVVGPKPLRAKKAEAAITGKIISEGLLDEAGEIAAAESQPRDSIRGEAWYRKEMVQVLTKRAISQSIERIVNAE